MNIVKLGLAGIVAALAVTLFGTTRPAPQADADPLAVVALSEGNCIALGSAFAGLDAVFALTQCQSMSDQGRFQNYVHCLLGFTNADGTHACLTPNPDIPIDDPSFPLRSPVNIRATAQDFAGLDIDANQIHFGQAYEVMAFVKDDFPVLFKTDKGNWVGTSSQEYLCDTQAEDPDCDGVGVQAGGMEGDGVAVARLELRPEDGVSGEVHINVVQENISYPITLTIVGPAETITMEGLFGKDTIQTGATQATMGGCGDGVDLHCQNPDPTDCNFSASVDGVLGANNQAEKMVIVTRALDNAGNEVSGALLNWNHTFRKPGGGYTPTAPDLGPTAQGGVALPTTPTIDTGTLGIMFPQFVCGGSEPGDLELTVTFNGTYDTPSGPGQNEQSTFTVHVIGPATDVALKADPPSLDCNGTNTTTITATFVNAEGNPVADGLDATFNVQALGTLTPITANTAKGVVSTVLTPLSGGNNLTADGGPAGVIVNVTANGQIHALYGEPHTKPQVRWDQVTKSILVQCTGGPPPPGTGVAAPEGAAPGGGSAGAGAGPSGRIAGPDTGSGGAAAGGSLTWWPLLALAAAAMTLGGATVALRRDR